MNIISIDVGFNGTVIINNTNNNNIDIYKLNTILYRNKKMYNLNKIYDYMLKYEKDNNILVIEEQTMFYKQAANISKFITGYGILIGLFFNIIKDINNIYFVKPKIWQNYINSYYLDSNLISLINAKSDKYIETDTYNKISNILPGLNKKILHDIKLKSTKTSKLLSMLSFFYYCYDKGIDDSNIDLINKILNDDNSVDAFNIGNYYILKELGGK